MSSTSDNEQLIIRAKESLQIDKFQVEIIDHLGLLNADVHYFKVKLLSDDSDPISNKFGLLRVGFVEGSLNRELQLRQTLGSYGMVAELLAHTREESVLVNPPASLELLNSAEKDQEQPSEISSTEENSVFPSETTPDSGEDANAISNKKSENNQVEELKKQKPEEIPKSEIAPESIDNYVATQGIGDEQDGEDSTGYLEEQLHEEIDFFDNEPSAKILLLTYLPEEHKTLEAWLNESHSPEEYLSMAIQICQFFSYINKRKWCVVNLLPQLIEIGKPSKFFDLTTAYPIEEKPSCGLVGDYYAPELATAHDVHEPMASYVVGALLYQCFHQKPPPSNHEFNYEINPIPRIYQLLKICLSPIAEERFPLSQLLSLLVETRNLFRVKKIQWQVASQSTLGLSTSRLTNEDNYGLRQQQLSDSESLIMGVVADGMGGMAQGEVASQIAVKSVLEEPIPQELLDEQSRADWLISLFKKANESIANTVKDGGTTLSLVLAIADRLMVAHVGDSRIYLIRQGEIKQLSEDHSLVAMMVASGQITQEESLEHPDRNVLTKSLGSKRRLSDGYVQDLKRTSDGLSMTLENDDILLLCSDGVWDLVSNKELTEMFISSQSLQSAVDKTINKVLEKGASDNATLLALQCKIQKAS